MRWRLNVTPDEFRDIKNLAPRCLKPDGSFDEGIWVNGVGQIIGASYSGIMDKAFTGPIEVKVIWNAPYIPMLVRKLDRWEAT